MRYAQLGSVFEVSRLVLGGGGLGQVWGKTTRSEAVATVAAAVDAGINLLDMAPLYGRGEAELVVGAAFNGQLPDGVRVATKCMLGAPPADQVAGILRKSLADSLERLQLRRVDLFLLHGFLVPNDYQLTGNPKADARVATPWDLYIGTVRPALQAMVADGLIGAWGLSGIGLPRTLRSAMRDHPRPAVVQCVSNVLDSAGGMRVFKDAANPRNLIKVAMDEGVGVLGIRAVQAGALTTAMDRELPADDADQRDWLRAAPFRALAAAWNTDPAVLAHRYALSIPGVNTVVLGVKNRDELAQCLQAEAAGTLTAAEMAEVDALGLRSS